MKCCKNNKINGKKWGIKIGDYCYRDGYVKMKLLGTDEKDYYVKMETTSGEDSLAVYARSFKCKYDKQTDELLSRDIEAFSTYYKNIG